MRRPLAILVVAAAMLVGCGNNQDHAKLQRIQACLDDQAQAHQWARSYTSTLPGTVPASMLESLYQGALYHPEDISCG